MKLNDFRSMVHYYLMAKWHTEAMQEWQVENWFLQSGGNWANFHQSFRTYRNVLMDMQ
jgi:hypothetical protein